MGGLLQAAIGLSDEFLSKDKLIVYLKAHTNEKCCQINQEGLFEIGDLVVLIANIPLQPAKLFPAHYKIGIEL